MIDEMLNQAVGPIIAIFLVSAMFSLGLDLTLRQIVSSLRDRTLVIRSVLVNLLAVPLLAVIVTSLIPMDEALRIGIVVYAISAGTEGGPKFVQMIKGNSAFAFGLLTVLLIFTVTLVPLIIPLVIPHAEIHTGALVVKLLLVVALPICSGLFLNGRYPELAARLSPFAHHLSMFLLYGLFFLLIYVNFGEIASLQGTALLAGLLFFALAFTAGYFAAGPDRHNRRALGIMTFARNGSISMLIAREVFMDQPQVLVMATIMTVASVVIVVVIVNVFRRLDLSGITQTEQP
jgi:BASS family bile acid:Na+ symporter